MAISPTIGGGEMPVRLLGMEGKVDSYPYEIHKN
jgi:hypothetical protein